MKNLFLFYFVIFISFINVATAQIGSISGTVKDETTGEDIPFVNVLLEQNGNIIIGSSTDFNGYYEIKGVPIGNYNLLISFIGYATQEFNNIKVEENKNTIQDVRLTHAVDNLTEVQVVEYKFPFIAKDQTTSGGIAKIRKKASRQKALAYHAYGDITYIDHNTESYDYINENKFLNTLDNPLSTFSVDVDRASYSNVRRFLNNSQMPNVDAVRIEEMVNYFDYDYKQPDGEHPFETYLEMGNCPWNPNNNLLMIGIQGESISEDNLPPSNFVFLIDVSGSMNSYNKLPLLKSSFNILIEQLRPQDRVAIVVYSGTAGCILPSTSGDKKEKIKIAINELVAGGYTAGGEGIKLAYKIAQDNFIKDGNNRIILATDGDFNVGVSSDSEMERLIENNRNKGVYLTILGFGMGNYKDSKMEKMSNKGNGNYFYVDNILESNKIFGYELWGTLYTIAKDVKIQIEFNHAKVKEYRLIGYENRLLDKEDFNDDEKDAGEIGSGHSVTAIYELILANEDKKGKNTNQLNYQKIDVVESNDLMTLKIRYKEPNGNDSKLIESRIENKDINIKNNSDNFMLAVAVVEFGMLLRDSEYKGSSDYDDVLTMVKGAKGEDKYGYREEFINLIKKAKILSKDNK